MKNELLAPNGKPSNLTPTQYQLVRTPAFKKWFGDWENDPANASKIVDDNGEPMVVYHGTNSDFTKFSLEKVGSNVDYGMWGSGFYFSPVRSFSKYYGSKILKLFLNIRNPFVRNPNTQGSKSQFKPVYGKEESIELRNEILNANYDGVLQFESGEKNVLTQIVSFEPNQIKLADGTNTKFDSNSDDIRYEQGGGVFSNRSGENFWGNIGGGVLPVCTKTKRILVPLRSRYVNEPNQIGVWGGKADEEEGENELGIVNVVKREFREETGYNGEIELIPAYIYQTPSKSFTYYNFIGLVEEEFTPLLDWETKNAKWITLEELVKYEDFIIIDFGYGTNKYYKHFGLMSLLNDKNSMDLLTNIRFAKGGVLKAEDMLKNPITIKRFEELDDEDNNWFNTYHAKTKNYKPNTYYHLNTNRGLNAGVGKGLYLGRDKDALIAFYDLEGENKTVDTYVGSPNWLDLMDYKLYDQYEQKAIRKYGKNYVAKNSISDLDARGEMLRKLAVEQGFDGIRYYDPQATGEEFVLFDVNKVKKIDDSDISELLEMIQSAFYVKGGKVKDGGDCYLVAGQLALEIKNEKIDYKGTPYLVHAEVKHSSMEGLRFGHAFIEDDENVYDFSNKREIILPKQLYYYFGDINPRDKKKYRKYTFEEAREKMLSTGNYGCWDIEVDFEKGGRVFNDKEMLAKFKKGESIGFTGVAHLKSKGLIPRADGVKRISEKYMENGGRTISQTPSPKKDQIVGSDVNKKSSSENLSSAKLIKFDAKTLNTIKNKVAKHNEENPNKKINLASAKAVVRRGMGAYSQSHRPTITNGLPNSRLAWGLARLNAFTYKIINGKSKSGKYKQDDDLIEELGFKVANYKNGGEMKKDIRCINCGWEWNKKDSELWDMYVCHKCGFDNTTFYTSIPVNNYSKGGETKTKSPNYLKMFLGK